MPRKDAPSVETTDATDRIVINHADIIDAINAGERLFAANSAKHAGALEAGHSKQANLGMMVNAIEFPQMALNVARRLAA
jgi:hypothetical protein